MASRTQQDTFIDDDSDEACPLCVEEFDISDRNFKPCPCGYQICQFCFNNIRTNLNGQCPACRRPYDDKTIEWKIVSPEEFKADLQKQARKKEEQKRREAQKREYETQNRKHLSGLRVVQKNLVYVVGLNPSIPEQELLPTLRGEQFFGQYGPIVKIVASKPKEGINEDKASMAIYVTFEKKEDAQKCIDAVNGSRNGDRILKAQFGTTKYCSAYLRNEQCLNKGCMFLHEPGEDKDSFTREGLSSKNVESTQTPGTSSAATRPVRQQPHPLPQRPPQPVAAAAAAAASTQPMARNASEQGSAKAPVEDDGSALPSSASWANKGHQAPLSRRSSQVQSTSTPSPPSRHATTSRSREPSALQNSSAQSSQGSIEDSVSRDFQAESQQRQESITPKSRFLLDDAIKAVTSKNFRFVFDRTMFTEEELKEIDDYPPMFDMDGGRKRRAMRDAAEADQNAREEEARRAAEALQSQAEEPPESGSLQLGGEPESSGHALNRFPQGLRLGSDRQRQATSQQSQPTSGNSLFGTAYGQQSATLGGLSNLNVNGRGLTAHQQQLLRSGSTQPGNFLDQFPTTMGSTQGFNQTSQAQSGLFQNQNHRFGSQGHARQSSRYSFANDSASSAATVKPATNPKLMAQQSAMMPASQLQSQQQHQSMGGQAFSSGMQGPPPGLKASTPPVSGGGMFGQGHGFGNTISGGSSFTTGKENNAELLRDLLRGRTGASGAGNGQASDVGKREFMFPSFLHQYPSTSTPVPAPGLSSIYGSTSGLYPETGPQKQKKKGKKHRHANTSSSGGGGIVDLADPSILQARMQQQGGGNSGQGLFSGQGQGGYNTPASMMYSARW